MRLLKGKSGKSFTAKDAKDAKDARKHRVEIIRDGRMPNGSGQATHLYPDSLLTFLRVPGVLGGERHLNFALH